MVCWLSFLFKKLCRRLTLTDTHTQISKNRPPHVNFCFRRRTKLYGALRAPIKMFFLCFFFYADINNNHNHISA